MEGSGALSVVVQGPSGCGKTSLLRDYLSLRGRTVGDSVMVVHLGEQIDSKVSYFTRCIVAYRKRVCGCFYILHSFVLCCFIEDIMKYANLLL